MASELSRYIGIVAREPQGAVAATRMGDAWAQLKVPWKEWPEKLRREYQQEAYFLFPSHFAELPNLDTGDQVALCHETEGCHRKGRAADKRDCALYARGICAAGTGLISAGASLSYATIGRFLGISKQRVEQLQKTAQLELLAIIARDPVLREYCETLGGSQREVLDEAVAETEKRLKHTTSN